MLKTNQVGAIKKYMVANKKTIFELAKDLKVNRGYLSMVLNGTMSNPEIETKVLEWYNKNKENK
jgi:transcriptional regulator with XRE-family HTH domain